MSVTKENKTDTNDTQNVNLSYPKIILHEKGPSLHDYVAEKLIERYKEEYLQIYKEVLEQIKEQYNISPTSKIKEGKE